MLRTLALLALVSLPLWLSGCSDPAAANNNAEKPRAVLTQPLQQAGQQITLA